MSRRLEWFAASENLSYSEGLEEH